MAPNRIKSERFFQLAICGFDGGGARSQSVFEFSDSNEAFGFVNESIFRSECGMSDEEV